MLFSVILILLVPFTLFSNHHFRNEMYAINKVSVMFSYQNDKTRLKKKIIVATLNAGILSRREISL